MLKGVLKIQDTAGSGKVFVYKVNMAIVDTTLRMELNSDIEAMTRFNVGVPDGLVYSRPSRVLVVTKSLTVENAAYTDGKVYPIDKEYCTRLIESIRRMQEEIKASLINGKREYKSKPNELEFTELGVITKATWFEDDLAVAIGLRDVGRDERVPHIEGTKTLITLKRLKKAEVSASILEEVDKAREDGYTRGLFYHRPKDLIDLHPESDFSWLLSRDYTLVTDLNFDEVVAHLSKFKVLAMDTETTGLRVNFLPSSDKLVGIVLSGKVGESFYFPLRASGLFPVKPLEWYNGDKGEGYDPLTADPVGVPVLFGGDDVLVVEKLRGLLTEHDLVVFNAAFDFKIFLLYGLMVNIVTDVRVMVTLGIGNPAFLPPERGSLKSWTERLLHRQSFELDMISKTGKWGNDTGFSFRDLPYELVRLYACPDTDNTLELYEYLRNGKYLEKENAVKINKFETQFACAIGYSEFYGHHLKDADRDLVIADLKTREAEQKAIMDTELIKAGVDPTTFNPNSFKQKAEVLYERLKYPVQRGFTGKITTDSKALERLASVMEDGAPKYPVAKALIGIAEVLTLLKSFESAGKGISEEFAFSSVNQFLTTGRVSVSEPNYQSYNDAVKKYIKPRDGYYMIDLDYSSIESRIMASLAGAKELMEQFKDPDMDYHRLQAARLFKKEYEEVDKELRSRAKALNFGIPYGMGAARMGESIFGEKKPEHTAEAQKLLNLFFIENPELERFFNKYQNLAESQGYVETYFGRRRYFNFDKNSVSEIRRMGGNHVIQGTAADLYKIAISRLIGLIAREGLSGKLLIDAFVHDEALLEVSKEIHPLKAMALVTEACEYAVQDMCPIYMGMGFGRSWYEAKATMEMSKRYQFRICGRTDLYDWDGDMDKFIEWLKEDMAQEELELVIKAMTNADKVGEKLTLTEFEILVKLSGYGGSDLHDKTASELWSLCVEKNGLSVDGVVLRHTPYEAMKLKGGSGKKALTPDEVKALEVERLRERVEMLGMDIQTSRCLVLQVPELVEIAKRYLRKDGTEDLELVLLNPDTGIFAKVRGGLKASEVSRMLSEVQIAMRSRT